MEKSWKRKTSFPPFSHNTFHPVTNNSINSRLPTNPTLRLRSVSILLFCFIYKIAFSTQKKTSPQRYTGMKSFLYLSFSFSLITISMIVRSLFAAFISSTLSHTGINVASVNATAKITDNKKQMFISFMPSYPEVTVY